MSLGKWERVSGGGGGSGVDHAAERVTLEAFKGGEFRGLGFADGLWCGRRRLVCLCVFAGPDKGAGSVRGELVGDKEGGKDGGCGPEDAPEGAARPVDFEAGAA